MKLSISLKHTFIQKIQSILSPCALYFTYPVTSQSAWGPPKEKRRKLSGENGRNTEVNTFIAAQITEEVSKQPSWGGALLRHKIKKSQTTRNF